MRVDTSLVVVPVRVLDSNGRFVPDLKKENFRLFEDKTEQEIVQFDTDNTPVTVALLLDVSDSTKFKLKEIQAAASAFLERLRPKDYAIIFAFDKNLVKICEGKTETLENFQKSVQLTRTGGGTALYDAVEEVVGEHLKKYTGKKAVVLLTDGVDTTSRQTYLDSLRAAQESNALIYSIQYETVSDSQGANSKMPGAPSLMIVTAKGEPLPLAYKRGTMYLNSLSHNSGGRFYFADTVENLSRHFARIAAELSQLYSLSYYPENQASDGKRRKIKVELQGAKAKLLVRKSYVYKSRK